MPKTTADGLKKIEISWLKKHGYLDGWKSGTITWTNSWWGTKSSVGITLSTLEHWGRYLQITYTQTDGDDVKKDFDYKIQLTTTPCRYGGFRCWFICPFSANGRYCGRRVGVLYKAGDYFACRHCYDLSYDSRNLGGLFKRSGATISIPELERLEGEVKRKYYNGKPTRKYLRFLTKQEKSLNQLYTVVAGLESMKSRRK